MTRTFSLALILVLFTAAAIAQEQPPTPKPGPEHALLKKLEGTWDAVMKMAEVPAPMKGVATYKMELDGMWLTSEFKMDDPAMKFTGRGLDGFDQNKKKYVGIWVDSMSSAPMVMEGTFDERTKTSTMLGEGPGPDGKPQKYKIVTKHVDDDHQNFEMFMVGADGKESSAFTIAYTRKKK
ncbi:MAG TPA: DUF1579 domain-containing protein [Pirellulaceae bacterium]|nr:DUF1579 domain-containing protein [Pirellulaceae bacterium]